ncbi:MAG: ABC transporter permease [Dehalococcoidia bacterium]|nr:ABC transporter permease [Dehalococcoidia bacterium]
MLSLKVAIRFLKSGRTQTVLIILGISIAISIQVFVGLLIGGLQQSLVDSTIGNSPHITVSSATDVSTIRDWEALQRQIEELGVTQVISASASANAFVIDGDSSLPVLVRGFDFEDADQIYNISSSIYEGRPYQSAREVMIGRDLQEELEVNVGDKLTITLSNGSEITLTISGFYDLGVANINKTWVISNLRTVQKVFGFNGRITSIEVAVEEVFQADVIAAQIRNFLANDDIKVENWKELNEELLSGLDGQRISSTIIQAVIILSVVIAIASVLAISVLQKSRQIGILKAMGIKDLAASLIFIYQGFLIGLIGSILGMTLGLGLLYAFNTFTMNPDGTALIDLYIDYDFIIRSWIIAVVASTLAGLIPARKSLQLDPIEVIREG